MNTDDTQWGCTVCGRVGTVGRCCGVDTREPLNDTARKEAERNSTNEKDVMSTQDTLPPKTPAEAKSGGRLVGRHGLTATIYHADCRVSLLDGRLVCNQCGQVMRAKRMRDEFKNMTGELGDRLYEMQTLVGYCSPPGHNHDDNCWTREYICANGHTMKIGKRRKCPACEWAGRESCGCHDCIKVDEFPEPSNASDQRPGQ